MSLFGSERHFRIFRRRCCFLVLILLYINRCGDRCYYVSIVSVGIIISKFTDVIFIYVLPLVWVYGCCDCCVLVKFFFSVAIIFLFLIAAVF